ncbi:DUF3993 domain-containing protein [Bacillus sp. AK031]
MKTKVRKVSAVLLAAILCMAFINQATALDKGALTETVKRAFEKQVSLSEKPRTMEEVEAVMDTHFTSEFRDKFILENVIQTDEGFQTFGSDFAAYYIPNFQYGEKTKTVKKGEAIYLYEYFTYDDGPVYFEDGYQAVKLVKQDGVLKVDDIYYSLPEEVKGIISDREESGFDAEREMAPHPDTVLGEEEASAPLSLYYWNKQLLIFQGFFLDIEAVFTA